MSKRKPLMGKDVIHSATNGEPYMRAGVIYAIDYYERLIDEGKLRVVEEVDVDIPFDSGNCRICHAFVKDGFNYCPGCGGKIKR